MKNNRLVYFVIFLLSAAIARGQANLTTLGVSAGQAHALALRSDGSVWAWGTNRDGELGLGTNNLVTAPQRVANVTNIIAISAGALHSLAVQSNGIVWAWGLNTDGRLGNGTSTTSTNPVPVSRITNAVMVAAGGSHSLAVLANGQVMAWGSNLGGQLGTGNTISTNQPLQAGGFTNVIAVAAGTNFSLALTANGNVYSWGTNNMGQLGLGNTTWQLSPVQITTLSNIVQIAAGSSHCLARNSNGVVYAWGGNAQGQLGDGTTVNALAPEVVPNFGSATNLGAVKAIAAGYEGSAAILKTGRLFYWGWYGNGTFWASNQPPQELNANSGLVFQNVTYGDTYLLAGMQDGSTWAWGFNQFGQRGNGNVYALDDNWSYELANAEFTFSASPYPVTTRWNQGDRNDLNYLPMLPYNTFVLPLDMEQGIRLNNQGTDAYCYGAGAPWFLNVQQIQRQHVWQLTPGTTNVTRFPVSNPVVAFGSAAGGSPLYVNQPYRFGIFSGAYDELSGPTNMIRVLVYSASALASGATNITPTNIFYISLPRRNIATDDPAWSNYVTNGNQVLVSSNGLITSVSFNYGEATDPVYSTWGLGWIFGTPTDVTIDGYRLTHEATSTNYCYIIEALGSCEVGANVFAPMGVTNNTGWAYLPMYALGFSVFPEWRSHFLDNPNFAGTLAPPSYTGRTSAELSGLTAVITNNIWLTNNPAYTNLDTSPELRRSPILDQFVADMGNNPLALANYVINNVALTDPVAYGNTGNQVANSIEIGGINRSALGTYLEGQGSPAEQCALLVYLLRSAGYPATYVFPTNSNLQLLSSTVSRLWQINVGGVVWNTGIPVITNSLIVVNYPWVVANIGTNSVQIFPWLKNTAVSQGLNIYDYMPTNYPNAYAWVKDYSMANPALMAFGPLSGGIEPIWQSYLTSVINSNSLQPNLSLQNFGVWSLPRPYNYTSWGQLPVPDVLENQSQVAVIRTLSDSAVTYPFLTNMFDAVRIEVFQSNTNSENELFNSGLWDICDLQNRKLLLYTNTPSTVSLWLSAYRSGITNISNFTNYPSGTNALLVQSVQASLGSSVTNFTVRITYQKRIGLINTNDVANWFPSLAYYGNSWTLNCFPSDVSAIIPSVASVSPAMLQVWAQDYWNLQQERATNTSFVPPVTSEAGDAAMIMASTFFQKLWSDNQLNQNLHNVRSMSWDSWGVASLTHLPYDQMQVKLNMNWFATFLIGNAQATQASGDTGAVGLNNFLTMMQANGSSAEYSVISSVWSDPSPVSTIRLLQIAAQSWQTNATAPPIELNIDNYTALGNQTYTGYGSTALKNQMPSIWSQVINVFTTESDSNFVRILITPGLVTNSTGSFQGMAALIFGETETGAIIGDNRATLNGGVSDDFDFMDYDDFDSTFDLAYNLSYDPSGVSYTFVLNSFTTPTPVLNFSPYDIMTMTAPSGTAQQISFTPQQTTQGSVIADGLNLPSTSTANAIQAEANAGWFGGAWAGIKQAGTILADPVQVVSGDFCADSVDVALAGPMPLELRRNYQSRNLANEQFGAGWKMSIMPWLVITTNAATNIIINAAEMDGSVLAYRYQTNNLWTVMPADNPGLVNYTPNGIGGTANLFNNQIQQNPTNSQIYTLLGADGSKRIYQVLSNFAITSGTNQLNRIRPYLTLWEDHAGNNYQFIYGTNVASDNFGQLYRIQGANGTSLTFEYDFYGRVTQVITDDSRVVNYQYDSYGDLVNVTLPDETSWQYGYQHYTFTTNSQSYTDSYHLLATETKPDGRQLVNTYDSLRRVINQQATVGANRQLITNAWFFYTNNCTTLTNTIVSGVTCVKDVFQNSYFYYYTNNLVTQIIEPLGTTNTLSWYPINETNGTGYYQNSLQYSVDARGLTNWFLYDSNGNITNVTTYGNLTGAGIASSTNAYTYTTYDCPATATDPSGNQLIYAYGNPSDVYQLTSLQRSNGGIGISTNTWSYTNVTSIANMGGWFETNNSFGLCAQEVRASTATNAWVYNGRGFPVQVTRYAATADLPGDGDPGVVTYFSFSPRGDLLTATDANGRQATMDYDNMGRLQWRDFFDRSGNNVSRETYYYDSNGELQWYDGPRSNPDDYVWFSYDGAGRKVQEIHYRTQANPNGTGIQAVPGSGLFDTTFSAFDYFGNLTSVTDQRGASTTNSWDALGRLIQRQSFDVGGGVLLATEGFSYEPGGLVQSYTNALGGITTIQYNSTGQPQSRQNADGSTNGWTYYVDGRINREIQGNGAYWQSAYDDVDRIITRVFCSPSGVSEATNSLQFDRRGNAVQFIDAGGNAFSAAYDGFDRVKYAVGPIITTVTQIYPNGNPTATPTYQTNSMCQGFTNYFDAAGQVITNVNAAGETTVSWFDVLGRTTQSEILSATGSLVHQTGIAYSSDFNSYTVTNGAGASAIMRTTFTDNNGQDVLDVAYPSPNTTEFVSRQYDPVGNLTSEQHNSSTGGAVTTWTTASFTYDGLNRLTSKYDRDNAPTTYAHDPMGDLTSRTLPGGAQMLALFNNAGQVVQDWWAGTSAGTGTRTNTYAYFASGSPFAGQLQTKVNGRLTTNTFAYDDWLRVTNRAATGLLPEQNLTTAWQFEPRGYLVNYSEQFASTNTDPMTSVQRTFDPYGQLATETVNNGASTYSASQSWDATGRRTSLGINGANYGFAWRADGALIAASNPTGSGSYGYDTAGLLTNRLVAGRDTLITSRDGEGRPLSIATTVDTVSQLGETLNWSGDGLLANHTLVRGDLMTDNRNYSYANLSRRLTRELVNLSPSTTWTNSFAYDQGVAGGPGALTTDGPVGANFGLWWSGVPDAFSRVNIETNNAIGFLAFGVVNGQSTLSAYLDNQPIQILAVGTNSMQWRTFIELSQGAHQLAVSALHPSGFYTAWATNLFTNNITNQVTFDTYDGSGNITNRVYRNATGETNRTQFLSWDAEGRLRLVMERNTNNYGFNWSAVYDGLGRRLSTTTMLVSNGVPSSVLPQTLSSFFDPQSDFLELGVLLNSAPQVEFLQEDASPSVQTVWKLYGPDSDGTYGGENGTGGLEGVSPYLGTFNPVISDARGNVLAEVTNGVASWTLARPTGYGAVPSYLPVAYGNGVDLAQSSAWRGREVDVTGYYHLGLRDYDPVAGQWLSYDPLWNAGDPNGQSFCAGDPVDYFDPSGMFGKKVGNSLWNGINTAANNYVLGETDAIKLETGTSYQIGLNAAAVTDRAKGLGSSPLEAGYEGTGYLLGSFTGFTPEYEGLSSYDIAGAYQITSPVDRYSRIGFGTLGIVGTGFGLQGFGSGLMASARPVTWQEFLPTAQAQVDAASAEAGGFEFFNVSKRQAYMGSTPGKYSSVGQQVMMDMIEQGKLRFNGGTIEVLNSDGQWVDIATTDMSHKIDAVQAWNDYLYITGAKSTAVRQFMTDPNNYELDSSTINRSQGASLGQTYRPPGPTPGPTP